MADNFETFKNGITQVAQNSKRMDESLTHSEISVRKLVQSFLTHDLIKGFAKFALAQSTTFTTMKAGFKQLEESTGDIARRQMLQDKQLRSNLTEMTALKGIASKQYLASLKEESLHLQRQLNVSNAQLQVKQSLSRFNGIELFAVATLQGAVRDMYHTHKLVNDAVIDANSNLSSRIRITQAVLRTQQALGSELGVTRDAARELVRYGYDLHDGFAKNLKLVVQMHDGLGLSVTQGAELVAVFQQQLKTPARDIADAVTRVANDTALAADEAARLAINLGRAIATLRPGIRGDLAAVTELVGKYEGNLQQLGGRTGDIQELLTRMTTKAGLAQAGFLGMRNPEDIASVQGTSQVLKSFAAYVKNVVGNSQGWDRVLRLQVVADQFGVTAQQANLMAQAIEKTNSSRLSSITLEERYKEQSVAAGKSFAQLGRSLQSLLQQAVLPLLKPAALIAGTLAGWIKKITDTRVAVYGVTVALGLGLTWAVPKIWSATRAFGALTLALIASGRAAKANAASQLFLPGFGPGAAAAATGGGWAVTTGRIIGTTLMRLLAFVTGPIGIALGVGAGLGGLYWLIKSRMEKIDQKFVSELKEKYDDVVRRTVNRYGATGDTEGLRMALERTKKIYASRGYSETEIATRITRLANQAVEQAGTARFRKEAARVTGSENKVDEKEINDLAKSQAEMLNIANNQRKALLDAQKRQEQIEKQKIEEERRTRLLQPQPFSQQFFRQAYGY